MTASGRERDAAFAAGVVGALAALPGWTWAPTLAHWRPVARLGAALGTAEGDLGLLACPPGAAAETLLLVEREGSAPGNERNILKWYAALSAGTPVELRRGGEVRVVAPQRALLLLAFGPSPGWRGAAYARTVAFCALLADLVNATGAGAAGTLRAHVVDVGHEVADWGACGAHVGRELAGILGAGP